MSDEERMKLAAMIRTYGMIAPHAIEQKLKLMNEILEFVDKIAIAGLNAPNF